MIKKYKWKCRILQVNTPNYNNKVYKDAKITYQNEIKRFHKRFVKLIVVKNKVRKFSIDLIGFDGVKKKSYKYFKPEEILKFIDKMPISKSFKNKKIKPINLSLFSDYNPQTTTPGLGFKNKEKALYTINKIKNRKLKYQVNVIATMIGRAKKHPNKTKEMDAAVKVFSRWMKNYKYLKKKGGTD